MATTATDYFSKMVEGIPTQFTEADLGRLFKAMVEGEDAALREHLQNQSPDSIVDMAILASRLARRQYKSWFRLHSTYEDPAAVRKYPAEEAYVPRTAPGA